MLRHVYFLAWSCFILFRGMLTIKSASPRFSINHQFEDCKKEGPANITHQRYSPALRLWTEMKLVITVPIFVALLCVTAGMRKSVVKINSVLMPPDWIGWSLLTVFCFLGHILKHAKLTPCKREMTKFSKIENWVLQVKIRVKNSLNLAFKLNDITTKIATIEACKPGRFMPP